MQHGMQLALILMLSIFLSGIAGAETSIKPVLSSQLTEKGWVVEDAKKEDLRPHYERYVEQAPVQVFTVANRKISRPGGQREPELVFAYVTFIVFQTEDSKSLFALRQKEIDEHHSKLERSPALQEAVDPASFLGSVKNFLIFIRPGLFPLPQQEIIDFVRGSLKISEPGEKPLTSGNTSNALSERSLIAIAMRWKMERLAERIKQPGPAGQHDLFWEIIRLWEKDETARKDADLAAVQEWLLFSANLWIDPQLADPVYGKVPALAPPLGARLLDQRLGAWIQTAGNQVNGSEPWFWPQFESLNKKALAEALRRLLNSGPRNNPVSKLWIAAATMAAEDERGAAELAAAYAELKKDLPTQAEPLFSGALNSMAEHGIKQTLPLLLERLEVETAQGRPTGVSRAPSSRGHWAPAADSWQRLQQLLNWPQASTPLEDQVARMKNWMKEHLASLKWNRQTQRYFSEAGIPGTEALLKAARAVEARWGFKSVDRLQASHDNSPELLKEWANVMAERPDAGRDPLGRDFTLGLMALAGGTQNVRNMARGGQRPALRLLLIQARNELPQYATAGAMHPLREFMFLAGWTESAEKPETLLEQAESWLEKNEAALKWDAARGKFGGALPPGREKLARAAEAAVRFDLKIDDALSGSQDGARRLFSEIIALMEKNPAAAKDPGLGALTLELMEPCQIKFDELLTKKFYLQLPKLNRQAGVEIWARYIRDQLLSPSNRMTGSGLSDLCRFEHYPPGFDQRVFDEACARLQPEFKSEYEGALKEKEHIDVRISKGFAYLYLGGPLTLEDFTVLFEEAEKLGSLARLRLTDWGRAMGCAGKTVGLHLMLMAIAEFKGAGAYNLRQFEYLSGISKDRNSVHGFDIKEDALLAQVAKHREWLKANEQNLVWNFSAKQFVLRPPPPTPATPPPAKTEKAVNPPKPSAEDF